MQDQLVHIVCPDSTARRATAMLLAVDQIASRAFSSTAQLLAALPGLPQGVILVYVGAGESCLDTLAALSRQAREDPVIVVCAEGSVRVAVAAIKAGAFDYLQFPCDDDELIAAIHAAHAFAGRNAGTNSRFNALSGREREVLRHIVDGMTTKRIALVLGISPRTVETYRQQLMAKTGAASVSQLVRFGLSVASRH